MLLRGLCLYNFNQICDVLRIKTMTERYDDRSPQTIPLKLPQHLQQLSLQTAKMATWFSWIFALNALSLVLNVSKNKILTSYYPFYLLIMYRPNRSFNIPPGHTPGRREFDYQSLPGGGVGVGVGISCEISGVVSYHGGRGVRGFSWKRLCLYGQLVTRKGLKQALCRIWRYSNFNIFNIGYRLWIYECIKLCLQWNRIPVLAIHCNNKRLNRGKREWQRSITLTCHMCVN